MTGTPNDFPRINPMPQSPGDGADKWRCESCIYATGRKEEKDENR